MRLKPLPVILFILVLVQPGLCDEYKYSSHGKRDPFIPLVGLDKPSVMKLEDVTSPEDVILQGIATIARGKRAVMLNGVLLKEKDKVGDVEVKKITDKDVTLSIGGTTYSINISEKEGGKKGG